MEAQAKVFFNTSRIEGIIATLHPDNHLTCTLSGKILEAVSVFKETIGVATYAEALERIFMSASPAPRRKKVKKSLISSAGETVET